MPVLDDDLETPGVLPGVADPARLAAIERTGLLGEEADATLDSFARLAAAVLGAPAAFVTLVGADRQATPGAVQLDAPGDSMREIAMAGSICQFMVVTGEPLVIGDTRTDPLVQKMTGVVDGTVAAYIGVPLRTSSGHVLGSVCVHDRRPRDWTSEQLVLLRDLAGLVRNDIERRLTVGRIVGVQGLGRRLGDAVEELSDAVRSLVDLAEQQDDARLQRYAALTRVRSQRVGALAAELAEAAGPREEPSEGRESSSVDLRRTVERAVTSARAATGTQALDLDLPAEPLSVTCDPVRLERALVHLLVSALHHTTDGESLRVKLSRTEPSSVAGGPAPAPKAELTLRALGTRIPAGELGRIVTRFAAAVREGDEEGTAPAALRSAGGEVHVRSGPVRGRSSDHGLAFRARWKLRREPAPAVIDLRGHPSVMSPAARPAAATRFMEE